MVTIPGAYWVDSNNIENVLLGKYFRRIQCPTCQTILHEEFDYDGKQLSNFYEDHYKEEHLSCGDDCSGGCNNSCDCGHKCKH